MDVFEWWLRDCVPSLKSEAGISRQYQKSEEKSNKVTSSSILATSFLDLKKLGKYAKKRGGTSSAVRLFDYESVWHLFLSVHVIPDPHVGVLVFACAGEHRCSCRESLQRGQSAGTMLSYRQRPGVLRCGQPTCVLSLTVSEVWIKIREWTFPPSITKPSPEIRQILNHKISILRRDRAVL